MLKNIDPLLSADVLYALRAMGHGDALILCDANFPADSVARQTVMERLLRIDGVDAPRAARAILSVFPLDTFVDHAVERMEVVGRPDESRRCRPRCSANSIGSRGSRGPWARSSASRSPTGPSGRTA
jgi:L-fucose mutarotase